MIHATVFRPYNNWLEFTNHTLQIDKATERATKSITEWRHLWHGRVQNVDQKRTMIPRSVNVGMFCNSRSNQSCKISRTLVMGAKRS